VRRTSHIIVALACFAGSAVGQAPPANSGVRVIGGPPTATLPSPGLPADTPAGSALRPWLTPPNAPPAPPQRLPAEIADAAKLPANASATAPTKPQQFDTGSLRLKYERGQWQLWAGALLLKDFGASEADAHEALHVFRDLRVNGRGSVGGVFEYWLTDGQAPSAITRHKQIIPFDPASLRIEQVSGQWVLRDARVILYNFGPSQTEAQQALVICRQFGFNQLGYVGHPVPALKYLMKDPSPQPSQPAPQNVVPVSARMQASEASHPRLIVPGVGDIGDRVPVNVQRLDLRRERGEWVLYAGSTPMAHYGVGERDGRLALEALQQFRVTELCRVGGSPFGFFLSNGRPPQGTIVGTGARALRTDALNVQQIGGVWTICEGPRPLAVFGDHADDARHALAAIQQYHFDHVMPIDPGRGGQLFLFIKTKF
jgi:hypothetical protein